MRINPFVYGIVVLAVFFGIILGFQSAGIWSISGKVTASGEKVQPSAADVNTIKGWMTLEEISSTFNVPLANLLTQFQLPADTAPSTAIKDLETDLFSVTSLRTWLESRTQPGESPQPTPAAPAQTQLLFPYNRGMNNLFDWINRHWTLFSISVLVLTAGWIGVNRPAVLPSSAIQSAPQQGFFAPAFTLNTFEGQPVNLADLKGKVVLINFWASWCPPCRAEMQAIQHAYADASDSGLVVLAVNTTYQDDLASAAQFAREQALTFPLLTDPDGSVSRLYQVRAMPTSFFLDRQGKIQLVMVGGPIPEALVRSEVDKLLKEVP